MTPESPKTPTQHAQAAVPRQPTGDSPKTPIHETVSLLGLARANTPGGRHFVAPSVDELAAALPQFAVEKLIGAGGMGAVYRVRQKDLDRVAALKVLPRELAERPDFQERFKREAKALARLNHPHLVTVYEVGQTNGWCWLLMELVDGANLREVMSTGRLSPEQALKIVPQLCDALQYAHDHGVVHRDIKPENILIDTQGRLKLTDFGLAKMITDENQIPGASLTQTGAMVGTMHYMAPEQFEGAKVDHRADIYAVGVVLYEMLTGSLPLGRFQPPSRQISIDVRIDDVVLKALDKDPEQRYQRASDVRIDVDRVRADTRSAGASGGAAFVAVGDGAGAVENKKAKDAKRFASGLGVQGQSADGDAKEIQRWLDRRYFYGIVMALLGIVAVGMGVFSELFFRFNDLRQVRYKIGDVPYTADEISFALSQPPGWSTALGVLVGLTLVAGGWSLLTLRVRNLVVLGGIASLALIPVFFSITLPRMRDDQRIICAFIASLPILMTLWFTLRKSKLAPCFDPVRLAGIGYTRPSMGKSVGYGVGIVMGLMVGIGLGINESARPLSREVIDLDKQESNHLFYRIDVVSGNVSSIRSRFASLDQKLSADPALKKRLIEAGWSDQWHKKLDKVTASLDDMQRGDMSTALNSFSFPWLRNGLTRSLLVKELCSEARSAVSQIDRAIEALEARAHNNSDEEGLSQALKIREDWQWASYLLDGISRDSEILGVIKATEFVKLRDVVLGLTRIEWWASELHNAAQDQLSKFWYSPTQAEYLVLAVRQVAPNDTRLHEWLAGEIRGRTTTMVFKSGEIRVEPQ